LKGLIVRLLDKVIMGFIVVMVLVIIGYIGFMVHKNDKQAIQIARTEVLLRECRDSTRSAESAIERQNSAIEAAKICTVYVAKETQKIVTKYAIIRDTTIKSIKEDSSYENQINNIDNTLRNFYGGISKLRPTYSN